MIDNSKKILIISSIVTLFFSCTVFVLLYKKVSLNRNIVIENETKWKEEADRRDKIRYQNDSLKKIEKEKTQIESHFADSLNIVPFLDTIENIGKKIEVKAEVTLVDIPKDSGSLIIEMKALGSFEKLYNFLLLLENSSYEIEFLSINLEKDNIREKQNINKKDDNYSWQLNIKMKLLSFVN